jgi:hypothetical protein
LYLCGSAPRIADLAVLRAEMITREQNFGTTVTATWESLTVSDASESATSVKVNLVISGSANGQQVSSRSEPWSFGLVDEGGWRVCSAEKAP